MGRRSCAAAAAFLFSCWTLAAQQLTVDLDPSKTGIHWVLNGNVHTVHGTFRLREGHVTVDPATGIADGALVVDAASGESGNKSRDKHMHKDVLESPQFPEIRLIPRKVEGSVSLSGHSTVRVSGTFQIHGSNHDVTIPMDVKLLGGQITASGKFSLPYVDWGMNDPSNFLFKVDKSVEVEVEAVGHVAGK